MKINMRKLESRLRAVWEHASPMTERIAPTPWRYVPKAFQAGHPGWGVYDRKINKFLHDHEVVALQIEVLRDEKLPELLS